MVRATLIAVVEQPDVPQASDLGAREVEEAFEVLCLLCDLGQPNHGWHVGLTCWQELA